MSSEQENNTRRRSVATCTMNRVDDIKSWSGGKGSLVDTKLATESSLQFESSKKCRGNDENKVASDGSKHRAGIVQKMLAFLVSVF